MVYDSKDDLELITSTNSFSVLFNVSNTNSTRKDRSDDKGPEPEGVVIGTIGSNIYAFIALERIGGVMVYDVTNPATPVYVTYVNNRSLPSNGPDRGSEGIIFIPQSQSPNGQHIVIAANEVSSTLTFWGIPGCSSPLSSSLSVTGNTANACANNAPILSVPSATGITYQWSNNGVIIPGATTNTIAASVTGNYSVAITGGTNCVTGSITKSITVNPSPTLAVSGPTAVCAGASITQTLSGAVSYSYNSVSSTSIITFTPAASGNYTLSGIGSNSCSATLVKAFAVNPLPALNLYAVPAVICSGQSATLTATGATTYSWNTGSSASALILSPLATTAYTVSGTTNGCTSVLSKTVTVNPTPVITAGSSNASICSGETATLTANGGNTYSWNNGSSSAFIVVNPLATAIYTVTGTNASNCSATALVTQNVSECTSLKNEEFNENHFLVYPNPAVGQLTISYTHGNKSTVNFLNSLGSVVLTLNDYSSESAIDVSGLAKGIYIVHLNSNNKIAIQKIIVE